MARKSVGASQAKESREVQRAREKLKKSLEKEQKEFTRSSLQDAVTRIKSSIERHHPEPSFLKKKKFTIFGEGTNAAPTKSRQIIKLQKLLTNQHFGRES